MRLLRWIFGLPDKKLRYGSLVWLLKRADKRRIQPYRLKPIEGLNWNAIQFTGGPWWDVEVAVGQVRFSGPVDRPIISFTYEILHAAGHEKKDLEKDRRFKVAVGNIIVKEIVDNQTFT